MAVGALTAAGLLVTASPAAAVPLTVSGFQPPSGPVGTTLRISGTGFTSADTVQIGGGAAATGAASFDGTLLSLPVPALSRTGTVLVTAPDGSQAASASTFVVTTGVAASPEDGLWGGGTARLSGSGLTASTPEQIVLAGTAIGSVTTDAAGGFVTAVAIPWDAAQGTSTLGVVDPVLGTVTTPVTVLTTWPMFRYDAARTGDNRRETVLTTSTVSTLHQVWTVHLGGRIIASPAVADATVYIGSENKTFAALSTVDGSTRWTFHATGAVHASPAVVDGVVYFGAGAKVYALDAVTGAVRWTFTTGGTVYSSPDVTGGRVFVGSDDGKVYALDAASGTVVWTHTTGGKVESSPAVAGGRVVVGSQDGRVYALDQTTGARLWRRNLGGPVQSSPALSGAAVYVGANENLYKLDAATGTIRWTDTMNSGGETPFTVSGSAAVGGGDVELFSEGHINLPAPQPDVSLNKIVEVAAGSGAYVSFGATGVSPEAPFTSPFAPSEPLANGVVCAPSPTFRDILCDSPGGFIGNEGAVPTAASIVSSYALANGMVFVADTGGTVYAASV